MSFVEVKNLKKTYLCLSPSLILHQLKFQLSRNVNVRLPSRLLAQTSFDPSSTNVRSTDERVDKGLGAHGIHRGGRGEMRVESSGRFVGTASVGEPADDIMVCDGEGV